MPCNNYRLEFKIPHFSKLFITKVRIGITGGERGICSFVSLRSLQRRRLPRLRLGPSFQIQQTWIHHVCTYWFRYVWNFTVIYWRRERDLNPRGSLRHLHAFQACAFSHSAISPRFQFLTLTL